MRGYGYCEQPFTQGRDGIIIITIPTVCVKLFSSLPHSQQSFSGLPTALKFKRNMPRRGHQATILSLIYPCLLLGEVTSQLLA